MKKAAPQYQQSNPPQGQPIAASASPAELQDKAPTKIARVLAYLLAPCNSLNRFEAELLGDHCLNSTIAKLAHSYGLEFQRQPEKVPNRWGAPCDVTRYSLPDSQRQRARAVLARLSKPTKGRKGVAA
ncbi:hypothetical protein [Azotobacter beijerinckii]|uniref:Uncharacterized protein n=1 Tax=Azotobacter beijerinckii TaxID=170623 RepID=A0A1I4C4P7_9GAMM|nr:hypothetical protein [Azotobacter beijerinckii]SFB58259.1 hypothetical protein SAMN04244571_04002 [Azotobacter beijerinckii]SFK75091.1 hypothetical protein SAMN04244574_01744 [Azotobacter beijerinckii]